MYDERKEKFSFKSFFLTLLLVALFIFLMLWIFPTKWDVNKLQSTYDIERLSVLYDEIFANNVARMKDAAIGYFTNERMPQKVGESKKLTLKDMYDLHLVLKMKDKDGKECNSQKSYVEMTKYTEEYRLKVNLSCGDQEDYIIVYLGCYNYCPDGICEKRVPVPSNTTLKEEKKDPENPTPTPNPDPTPTPTPNPDPTPSKHYCEVVDGKYYDKNGNIVKKEEYDKSCNSTPPIPLTRYMYEYKLVTNDATSCGDWSNWQKGVVKATDLIKVETKTEKELIGYKTNKIQTGTKKDVITKKVTEKYISRYTTELVVVGTKQIRTGTTTKTVKEEVVAGSVEKFSGIDSGTVVPKDTDTIHYKNVTADKPDSCSYCENETKYTWEIWKVEPVYEIVTKTVPVPVYKTIYEYEERPLPIYDFRVVEKKETMLTPIYKEVKIPEYVDVDYYRYKTCTVEKGTTDIKWSYSKLDTDLIGKGYKLTGNVKKV